MSSLYTKPLFRPAQAFRLKGSYSSQIYGVSENVANGATVTSLGQCHEINSSRGESVSVRNDAHVT
jgi:hypothetical protein